MRLLAIPCARAYFYDDDPRHAQERLARLPQRLRKRYVGFEAKYRYVLLLKRLGRSDEAGETASA